MLKKHYAFAIVFIVLIPIVFILGASLSVAINPELAAGHANYVRNYRLISFAANFIRLATLLAGVVLWLLACAMILKAKQRSLWWLTLAAFGPFGLIGLTALKARASLIEDLYYQFIGRMTAIVRAAYELCVFIAIWSFAFEAIEIKQYLQIAYESHVTGVSVDQIAEVRNASGGMWAFGEGLEAMYVVVLCYLLLPVCFNAVARALTRRAVKRHDQ